MRNELIIALAAGCLMLAPAALAQQGPGMGPVAAACGDDIAKLCPGKEHGRGGEVRDCMEANKAKVSAACKKALETTGWGRKQQ